MNKQEFYSAILSERYTKYIHSSGLEIYIFPTIEIFFPYWENLFLLKRDIQASYMSYSFTFIAIKKRIIFSDNPLLMIFKLFYY